MKLSRIKLITLIMIVMSLMMSCRDELCYNHFPSMGVSLSWEHEWERDYGMNHSLNWDETLHGFGYDDLRPEKPEWVNLIRFTDDGSRYEHYLRNDEENIIVDPEVNHSLLFYNGDTQYIILSNVATPPQARASATDRTRISLAYISKIHPNTRTTNPPDNLYAAYITGIPPIVNHEIRPVNVVMKPLVYTYIIRYEFEYGNEHIAYARGALGGMAESVYLIDGKTSDESAIILFDCDVKDYGCEAHVKSFGVPGFPDKYFGRAFEEIKEQPYTLNLEVRLKNGNYVEFNYDVRDQIANQPRGGVIKVSGLRIENSDSYIESGFNVEVDGWGDRVEIDLPVGPNNNNKTE